MALFYCQVCDQRPAFSLLLAAGLSHNQGLVDVWNNTTTSNSSLDKSIKLFVTTDRQLEMTWGYSLHLKVLAGVTGELEDLSGEVFQNSCGVHSGGSSNTTVRANSALQKSVDPSHGELIHKVIVSQICL